MAVEFALSSTSVGCFFLDTCIILSEIMQENTARIEKLKNDASFHNVLCYVSDSVQQESYGKVKQASDFLGNVVRETMQYSLLESRKKRNIPPTDPIDSEDIKALEDLFSYYHSVVRTTSKALPSPVVLIEDWSITFLGNKLGKGVAVDIPHFLIELVKTLLKLTNSLEDSYDNLVTFQRRFVKKSKDAPNSIHITALQGLGIHPPDDLHIASAISHQANSNENTVFVTLDFTTILNKRHLIRKKLMIQCSDPLYALHHLV